MNLKWDDIEHWIDTGRETTNVDLKKELPLDTKTHRAEFAKLVSAMGNAPGGRGLIIIGVLDKKHRSQTMSLDDIVTGVHHDPDKYQKLANDALEKHLRPIPRIDYQEVELPPSDKRIGVVIVHRRSGPVFEFVVEAEGIPRGTYIRRGAQIRQATPDEISASPTYIINFSHPLTSEQLAQLDKRKRVSNPEIIDVAVQCDHSKSFAKQASEAVDRVGLTGDEWQTLSLLVCLPGYSPIAAAILAEIHGRTGHFPDVVRLRPKAKDPKSFEFAETIKLSRIRDQARPKRSR